MKADFQYQMQKFGEARSALMAPHSEGEAQSFAWSFHACSLGLMHFDRTSLDESMERHLAVVERCLDTRGLAGDGLHRVKAESLSVEQRREFSNAVDELASYFSRCFWSAHP